MSMNEVIECKAKEVAGVRLKPCWNLRLLFLIRMQQLNATKRSGKVLKQMFAESWGQSFLVARDGQPGRQSDSIT